MNLTCTAWLLLARQLYRYSNHSPPQKTTYILTNTARTSSCLSAHHISTTFLLTSPLRLIKVLQQHANGHSSTWLNICLYVESREMEPLMFSYGERTLSA